MIPALLLLSCAPFFLCHCAANNAAAGNNGPPAAQIGDAWHNHYLGRADFFIKWAHNSADPDPINRWSHNDSAGVRITFTGDQLRISCAVRDKAHNLIGSRGGFWQEAHFGASSFDFTLPIAKATPTQISANSSIAETTRYGYSFTKEGTTLSGEVMVEEPVLKASSRDKRYLGGEDYLDNMIIIKFKELQPTPGQNTKTSR